MGNTCGKKRYPSQKKANKAKKKTMRFQPDLHLAVYHCEECGGYHLSKHLHRIGS